MILIYCGKGISGSHYNPAVTVSIYYRGYCSKRELQYYVFFQLLGAVIASILYYYLLIPTDVNYEIFELKMSALISEFIFTFLLVFVILNVATLDATKENYYFGFAIAFVVFLGGILVGGISLASFNPAVTSALIIIGKINLLDSWIHIIPQLLSALLATFLFKLYHKID
jgi:aquaporin Z